MLAITRQGRLDRTFRPLLKRMETLLTSADYSEVVHLLKSRKMLEADNKVRAAIYNEDRLARMALSRLIANNMNYWQYPEFDDLEVKPFELARLLNAWAIAINGYGGSSRLSLYIRQNRLELTPQ